MQGRPWYLWCYGDPGSGKSVLAAQITDDLKSTYKDDALVLDLFIDDKDNDTNELNNLIGSLVKQIVQDLSESHKSPSQKLEEILLRGYSHTGPALKDLVDVLKELFDRYTRIFLIVDAWEKIPVLISKSLLSIIKDLSGNSSKIRVMVTATLAEEDSRKSDIHCDHCKTPNLKGYYFCNKCEKDYCEDCKEKGDHCSIQEYSPMQPVDRVHVLVSPNEDELRQYVKWEIDNATTRTLDRSLNHREGSTSLTDTELDLHLKSDPELEHFIPQVVSRKSRNLYQMAKVYVDLIKLMPSVAQIYATLEDDMPPKLNDFYDNMLKAINRIEPRASAIAVMEALYWIAFAEKPLPFPALNHVLGINLGSWSHPDGTDINKATLIRNSSGLINISFDDQSVRVHSTVNEWLNANKEKWFGGKDKDAALKILTYLNYEDLEMPCPSDSESDMAGRLEHLPFLEYACQYWDEHVLRVPSDEIVQTQLLKFLSHPGKVASYL